MLAAHFDSGTFLRELLIPLRKFPVEQEQKASDEAREVKGHFSGAARSKRNQIARFTVRGATGNVSKPNAPQLPHPFRDGRFHLSLSRNRAARFRQDRHRLCARSSLRRKQVAQVLSSVVSKRARFQ